jgi:hypothetical protein
MLKQLAGLVKGKTIGMDATLHQAMARSESNPSKYPIRSRRK